MNAPTRANPLDLGDFDRKPAAAEGTKAAADLIAAVADVHGFPSRQAPKAAPPPSPAKLDGRSRRRSGRTQQVNVKMTPATYEQLCRMSRERGDDRGDMAFGELLRLALDALESADRERGRA
jgi:hypothetical protein